MKMSGGYGRCKGKVRINSMKARLYVYPFFKKNFKKTIIKINSHNQCKEQSGKRQFELTFKRANPMFN